MMWIQFDRQGIPVAIFDYPADGTVNVDGVDLAFVLKHSMLPDGTWVPRGQEKPVPLSPEELAAQAAEELAQAKAQASLRVNTAAGQARLAVYTDLPGQDAIYLQKRIEAQAYLVAQPRPEDLTAFPFLAAEVGVTAPTAEALAQVWLGRGKLFESFSAATESARMVALKAIATVPDMAALEKAETEFDARLAAIRAEVAKV